jgi:hypothetical protein
MRTVECRWQFGLDLAAADQSRSSALVLVWSATICDANFFSDALPLSCASLFDSISNMSETATSLTKSAVVGLMPRQS